MKTRMFRYQRKRFMKLAAVKKRKVPEKVWRMQMRELFGPYGPTPSKQLREPDRVTRLREVLHNEPGRATNWGEISGREVLWEILARARCNIPGTIAVEW